ncbi:hypothetical protein ACVIM7_007085 [Bradyrhizobium liaoningense]
MFETMAETEGMRDRIDERADVAVLVHDRDVDGRGIHRRRHVRQVKHAVHADLADVLVGKALLEHLGDVDPHVLGRGNMHLAVHVGDACRFRLEMEALDAHGRVLGQIEARQDVEHQERGDARAVRRALPDIVALVQGAYRRGHFGRVRGEIVERVQAADAPEGLDHVLRDRPLVEGVAAILGDRAQGLAELGLANDVAGHRRLAARQQVAHGVGAILQLLELVLPVEGDAGRDDVAFLGRLDRRLKQPVETELAVVAQNRREGIDHAWDRDRMRRGQRHGVDLALEIPVGVRRLGRTAGAVIGDDLALAARLDQRKTVPADAGRLRLNHAEQGRGGNGRVHRRAAIAQHLDRRERGLRVRGRDHRVGGVDRGPAGEMEVSHRISCSLGRRREWRAISKTAST